MQAAKGVGQAGSSAAKPVRKRASGKDVPSPQTNTVAATAAAQMPHSSASEDERQTKSAKKRTEPLNFRVAPDFRRAFKRAAAAQDCKKVELLERIFAEWTARNPV